MNAELLSRREALLRMAQVLGVALIGGPALLRGQSTAQSGVTETFTARDVALLDEIAETIIPATHTPGAKAAQVGAFMAMMVSDCYEPAEQHEFRTGMSAVEDLARQRGGRGFAACSAEQRTALLNEFMTGAKPGSAATMFRQLTLLGYFTSEKGCLSNFVYEEVPGRYEGEALYRPGDKLDFSPPSRG